MTYKHLISIPIAAPEHDSVFFTRMLTNYFPNNSADVVSSALDHAFITWFNDESDMLIWINWLIMHEYSYNYIHA